MDMIKKDILEKIEKMMDATIMDANEIMWFRYIMDNLREIIIPGTSDHLYMIAFNNEDCPMEHIKFRRFLEDYRRDNK